MNKKNTEWKLEEMDVVFHENNEEENDDDDSVDE